MRAFSFLLLFQVFFASKVCHSLDQPVVSIQASSDGNTVSASLSWTPVAGAVNYSVLSRNIFTHQDSLLGKTYFTTFEIDIPTNWSWDATPNRFHAFNVKAHAGPIMTTVPSGTFQMGAADIAEPIHQVTLTNSFEISTFEISNNEFMTVAQWAYDQGLVTVEEFEINAYGQRIYPFNQYSEIEFVDGEFLLRQAVGDNGIWGPEVAYPGGYDPANHPIFWLSWVGAACYCDWLSELNGLQPFYEGEWDNSVSHNPYDAEGYRLPTEAEWEYAASFPDNRLYPWGAAEPDCIVANYGFDWASAVCIGWTTPQGSYPMGVSSLGLFDIAGNLREWTNDALTHYTQQVQVNPIGSTNSTDRVVRGGSWAGIAEHVNTKRRVSHSQSGVESLVGFRVCRSLHNE